MSTERTISATRRVEVKASPSSVSATVIAPPRTMTLHERFSQLPKAEPKKEEKVAAKSVDLNLFQEVGVSTRRAATEQRQSQKREEVVTARRAASSTWTPSFDDDVSPHVQVNFNDSGLYRENGAAHQRNGGAERRRQIEIARPVEPAFIVKGIPPPRAPAKQRIVVPDPRAAPRGGRGSAPQQRGRAPVAAPRGGRQAAAAPSKQMRQQAPVRGGRGGPVAARGAPGRGGAVRGGRGGGAAARGGGGKPQAPAKPKSKDDLDAELDSYMLQTPETAKNYLDQQLEDYMHAREQETTSSS